MIEMISVCLLGDRSSIGAVDKKMVCGVTHKVLSVKLFLITDNVFEVAWAMLYVSHTISQENGSGPNQHKHKTVTLFYDNFWYH